MNDFDHEYYLSLQLSPRNSTQTNSVSTPLSLDVLHQHLGHLNWSTLRHVVGKPTDLEPRELSTCEGCQLGKQTRHQYTSSTHRATTPFQLIHIDLCGPMQSDSIQGNKYFMIIVDNYTSAYFVHHLRTKDQALECFKAFHSYVKTALGFTLRTI